MRYSALFAALTSPALKSWYVWSLSKPVSHQQQLHSLGNWILFGLRLSWRRCWATSSGSHRFRDLEKDKRRRRTSPAPCSSFSSSLCFLWEDGIQILLVPFTTSVLLRSLSSFLHCLQEGEASAQTPLSVLKELGQQLRRGRADRGCLGLSCPSCRAQVEDTGHTWLSPGASQAESLPLPVIFTASITPSLVPLTDPVSSNTHWPSQKPLRQFVSSHLPKESKLAVSSLCSPLLWALWHISTEEN